MRRAIHKYTKNQPATKLENKIKDVTVEEQQIYIYISHKHERAIKKITLEA